MDVSNCFNISAAIRIKRNLSKNKIKLSKSYKFKICIPGCISKCVVQNIVFKFYSEIYTVTCSIYIIFTIKCIDKGDYVEK